MKIKEIKDTNKTWLMPEKYEDLYYKKLIADYIINKEK